MSCVAGGRASLQAAQRSAACAGLLWRAADAPALKRPGARRRRADERQKFDELVEDQGVRILIEPTAIMHVVGTKMDFVQDRLKCAPLPRELHADCGEDRLMCALLRHALCVTR